MEIVRMAMAFHLYSEYYLHVEVSSSNIMLASVNSNYLWYLETKWDGEGVGRSG